MKIVFRLNKQSIVADVRQVIAAKSKNYLQARFVDEGNDWQDPITAIFGDYTVMLDNSRECVVPWEVLQNPGTVEVSAFCGDLHTANIATFQVVPTGYKEGETPKDPTPDVYTQLTQMVQEAVDTANSVREDADAGEFDGEQGPIGPQGNPGPQGDPGPQGEPGQDGAAATIQVGQVTTLPAGQQATVTNVGTANAARFDFGIPKGQDGKDGTPGQDGEDGGYYAPSVDGSGNLNWTASKAGMPPVAGANIRGPQGPKGDPGLGVPSPTQSDAGKVPTVKADGSAYELAGPYAPLSAAIRPTASGNPAVCEDSVEWGLQGMRVYGKSTQVTTTGAQLLPVAKKEIVTKIKTIDVNLSAGDYVLSCTVTGTSSNRYLVLFKTASNVNITSVKFTNGVKADMNITLSENCATVILYSGISFDEAEGKTSVWTNLMLNAGSTALPFEPYTGGKPSPSPEYPQEIHSAGDTGNIGTTITGKNLLTGRLYYGIYNMGIASILNEDVVSLPYTPAYETYGVCYTVLAKKGKTYTFSVTNHNTNAGLSLAQYRTLEDAFNYQNAINHVEGGNKPISITASEDGILVCLIAGVWTNGTTTIHECTESELLQLEIGSTATAYEAPHAQSIVAITPNGLPGIPVDSGGNFVDADGQEWLCNYRDWARGVDVQNISKCVADGTTNKFVCSNNESSPFWNLPCKSALGVNQNYGKVYYSDYFSPLAFGANGSYDFIWTRPSRMEPYGFTTADELNAFCVEKNSEGKPLTIMYVLEALIETPIPADELAAYRALHAYDGTTVVSTAEDVAGLEVRYVADAQKYIDNKIQSALAPVNQAILEEKTNV